MSNLDPATIFPILTYPYQTRIEPGVPSSSEYLKYSPESASSCLLTPTFIFPNFNWTSATNGSSNFKMATLSRELYASMCIITLRYILFHVHVFDEVMPEVPTTPSFIQCACDGMGTMPVDNLLVYAIMAHIINSLRARAV